MRASEDPIDSAHSEMKNQLFGTIFAVLGLVSAIFSILWLVKVADHSGVVAEPPEGVYPQEVDGNHGLSDAGTYFGGMAVIAALVIPIGIQVHTAMNGLQQGLPPAGGKVDGDEDGAEGRKCVNQFTEEERRIMGATEGRFLQSAVINFAASVGILFLYSRETSEALNKSKNWTALDSSVFAVLFLFIIWFSFFVETGNMKRYNQARRDFTDDWVYYLNSAWARFMAYRLVGEHREAAQSAKSSVVQWAMNPYFWASAGAISSSIIMLIFLCNADFDGDSGDIFAITFAFAIFVFIFLAVTLGSSLWVIGVWKVSELLAGTEGGKLGRYRRWSWIPAEGKAAVFSGVALPFLLFLLTFYAVWLANIPDARKWKAFAVIYLLLGMTISIFIFIKINTEKKINEDVIYSAKSKISKEILESLRCQDYGGLLPCSGRQKHINSDPFNLQRRVPSGNDFLSEDAKFLIISLLSGRKF